MVVKEKQPTKYLPLVLNEEEQMLKESAKDFFTEKSPVSMLRALRDHKDPQGYSSATWKEMCDLGFAALALPEAYGGLDFGYVGLGQVLEEGGRTLAASPLISSVLLSGSAIQMGGSEAQKEALLPAIGCGEKVVSFALEEGNHHGPSHIALDAMSTGNGFVLKGSKKFVFDGHVADHFVIASRTSGKSGDESGITLFLVDKDAKGLSVSRTIMVDSRNAAAMNFDNVEVSQDAVIGTVDEGYGLLSRVLDIGRIGIAAELLGITLEAFDRTVAYLKERKQFGLPIGTFQALQHRAAHMYSEIELCKSAVLKALQAIDTQDVKLPALASLAKAKTSEISKLVCNEAIQMYGGIGMTDDEEIGFFLKRAKVLQQALGDFSFHADRIAKMGGY